MAPISQWPKWIAAFIGGLIKDAFLLLFRRKGR
jgi:hypothetical protein